MYFKYLSLSIVALFVVFSFTACSDAANDATKPRIQNNSSQLVKIILSPDTPLVAKNTLYPLSATGIYSDNSKADISNLVSWVTTKKEVVALRQNGLIEALNSGTAGIRASLQDIESDTLNVAVSDQVILSINVSPINPVSVVGSRISFRAEGLFSNGLIQDITDTVTWESSSVDILSFMTDGAIKGLGIGQASGKSDITATFSGISSEPVLLDVRDAQLVRIELAVPQGTMGIGTHLVVAATGFYIDDITSETFVMPLTNNVSWKSSNSELARISNDDPTQGLLFGLAAGTTEISANIADISSNIVEILVHDIALESIQINSTQLDLPLSLRKKFTAIGTYRNQVQQDISNDVVWLLRTDPIAFVDNAHQRSGLLVPSAVGQTKVTASFQSITSPPVDVNIVDIKINSIAVTPNAISLATGLTQQFSVIATLNDSSKRDITSESFWQTSNPKTIAVSNASGTKGLATALSVGEAEVFAQFSQFVSNRSTILTVDATLNSIQLKIRDNADPAALLKLPLGASIELVAEGIFNDGANKDITNLVTWNSSDNNVASVSNAIKQKGVLSSMLVGQSDIGANFNGIDASPILLSVTEAVLQSTRLSPGSMNLTPGQSQLFMLTGIYSNGPGDITVPVTWKSGDIGVATVQAGTATAVSSGITTITTSVNNRAGITLLASAALRVDNSALISIFPATGAVIKVNDLLPMSASGGRAPYTWKVSDINLATIGEFSGQLAALRSGTITVTATDADQTASSTEITIVPSISSITVSSNTNNKTVFSGDSISFQALATYSDGSSLDITSSAIWSLSTNVNNLAVISPTMRYVANSTAGLTGSIAMTAIQDGKSGVAAISIIAPTIFVSAPTTVSTIVIGGSVQLIATGGSETFSWSTSNANASISSAGLLTATTDGTVDAIATDSNGFFGILTLSIIPLPNAPPTANAGDNQIVSSGESVFLSGTGFDSDGTIVGFQWTKTSGPNIDLLTASAANTSFIAPIVSVPTTINLRLTVTDDGNATANASVTVTVNPLPVILQSIRITSDAKNSATAAIATVIAGTTVTYQAEATYSDNSIVDITLNSNTVWSLLATPTSLATSFANVVKTQPAGAATGSLSMTVSYAGITSTLRVNVVAPTIVISAPIVGPVAGGSAVPYTAVGGTLPYSWTIDNTSLASIDPVSGSLTAISAGNIVISVTDANGFMGTTSVSIARAANRLPIVSAGPDQTVVSGMPVYLLGTATDADGSIVSSQWAQRAGTIVTLLTPTSQRAKFTAPIVSAATVITLTLTSSDNDGATSTASVNITIKPASMLLVSEVLQSFVDPGLRGCVEEEAKIYYLSGLSTPLLDFNQLLSCTGFFTSTPITDLSGIENLPGLDYFSAPDNHIADLNPLIRLPNLKTLDLSNNVDTVGNSTILSYTLLSRIPTLESLVVNGNALKATDIVEISTIVQLIELAISRNPLTDADIVPIGNLSNLKYLELSGLSITSVAAFATLNNLERLNITQTLLGTAGPTGLDKLIFAAPPVRFFNTEIAIANSVTIPCIELEAFVANNPAVAINPFGAAKPGQAGNCT
ncbi:MAG: Ig-like domain-containing protein [Thiohalomonadales bacterium]